MMNGNTIGRLLSAKPRGSAIRSPVGPGGPPARNRIEDPREAGEEKPFAAAKALTNVNMRRRVPPPPVSRGHMPGARA
jgi:hypothetical protein